ncbi:(2Fe-2S)-binding protein [Halobacteriovorax sp. GFR7]|uniref:(2Fe-2S)-binding protein n=1 Tax=unclassified Halobacteriovorax TaxID=2639665 RepID=UPI003D979457
MYICICNAITQDMLDNAIKQGQTEKEVINSLGIGNSCGVCLLEQVSAGLAKKNLKANQKELASEVKNNLTTVKK